MRASTYQYQTAHLVYRQDRDWHFVPDRSLFAHIRRLLPPALVPAWGLLALNLPGREQERLAEPAAGWLAVHGHALGARTPNVAERARAADLVELCEHLFRCGLSPEDLFDAQCNAFDVDAFRSRIHSPLVARLRGAVLPPAALMPPANLGRHYSAIATRLAGEADPRSAVTLSSGPGWLWEDFCHPSSCGPGGRPAE